ncbi:MAG: PaaI family thioesterase [Parvibaculum sp.]|uniref:PaaI family thioesterase n=1 Tax=Parvibaculum sp. TaxID=2024848 RepID=UPI0025D43402|nr:PaaI family thioesterase [Parvibaculum sp.]MCE9650524.1 PaaI family thioesterase [Parvibaculum sp.]
MSWATERLQALKEGKATPPPVVKTLGLGTFDDWGPGWARKTWKPSPDFTNGDGSLFGGHIAALADQILAFATMSVVPDGMGFRTVNLSVQFFRVAREQAIDIEARVVAQSRQLISVEASFTDPDGRIFAKATAQQVTMPLR